jgi:hypothetical protein
MAIPALAQQGHPTVLRHHQLHDSLLHIGAMVCAIPMGDEDRVRIALGRVLTAERKARRVEMMQALSKPCVGTHRQGKRTQEEITPRGEDLIAAAAACETVAHVSVDAWTKQHVEGFVHKKLWGQRPGAMGKPSAVQHHPRYRFARGERFVVVSRQARVDHLHDPSLFDHCSHHSEMVQAFNADGSHREPSSLHRDESIQSSGEGIEFFLDPHLLNVG